MANNSAIQDIKPLNSGVFDTTPNNQGAVMRETEQLFSVTITSGMLMPIMAITYASTQTVMSPITQ